MGKSNLEIAIESISGMFYGYLEPEAAEMMRAWPYSAGFSVDGSVRLHDWERGRACFRG